MGFAEEAMHPEHVMPRLGLGIHEFRAADTEREGTNSWIPRPSLGMTIEFMERARLYAFPRFSSRSIRSWIDGWVANSAGVLLPKFFSGLTMKRCWVARLPISGDLLLP